ncbi:Bug family tripartite tricarboxylate transporter substrate binding protein [Alicycliphilus denitrificans]|uniref:Bug family tripartite tricarboxylate transporter substrate binding protein n=1 Tax=Alicycliphilus denitrificans TaxID=179636 RepID=UPI0001D9F65C|nr:tripartite tricarboxylate transporter substrate binding protein [Alicycliphilus denitrificans]ADV00137.1 hypothetical protein Alide_2402 [Alicycliphilus denitrificans BC]
MTQKNYVTRRAVVLTGVLAAVCGLAGNNARAEEWPTKTIKVLVPYVAGGPVDSVTRMLMEIVSKSVEQPIIIENKPGANTVIATAQLARSAPDGYTFGVVPAAYTTNQVLSKNLQYKPSDLAPVSHMVNIPLVLFASVSTPANSVKEFAAWAQTRPVSYASTGPGSTGHLLGEIFSLAAGLKATHVGYNGSAQAMPDLMGGRVDYFFDPATGGMPHVKAGKLKALAVSAQQRCDCAPDVPTMAESGYPEIVQGSWIGLMAPAKTPRNVLDRFSAEVAKAVQSPEFAKKLKVLGFGPVGSTPEQFQALIDRDVAAYADIARKADIRLDR